MTENASSPPSAPRSERLLLVEDDSFSSTLIAMYLEKSGFHDVVTAMDGREALDLARNQTFDLMLLDLNLPRLGGAEVLRRLRKGGLLDRMAVLVISSMSNMEDVSTCMDLGATDYLPKPFNRQLLESRVVSILERRRLDAVVQAAAVESARIARGIRALRAAENAVGADFGGTDVACMASTGSESGGTLLQVRRLPTGALVALAAEPVSRSVAGGLAASVAATRILSDLARTDPGALAAVLRTTNSALLGASIDDAGVRVALAVVTASGDRVVMASAGAPMPLLIDPDGVSSGSEEPGLPLGCIDGAPVMVAEHPLARPSALLLPSVGLCRNADGTESLRERLGAIRSDAGTEAFLAAAAAAAGVDRDDPDADTAALALAFKEI